MAENHLSRLVSQWNRAPRLMRCAMMACAALGLGFTASADIPSAYVETTGSQYLITDFCADPTTKVEADMTITTVTTATRQQRFFGSDSGEASWPFSFSVYQNGEDKFGSAAKDGVGNWGNSGYLLSNVKDKRILLTLDAWNGGAATYLLSVVDRADGKVLKSWTATTMRTQTGTRPLVIAGDAINDPPIYPAYMKIYSVKIWKKNQLVRCYVPYWNEGKSVIGLKELFSGNVIENSGSGTLQSGGELASDPSVYLPEGWPEGYRWNSAEGTVEYSLSVAFDSAGGSVTVDEESVEPGEQIWGAVGSARTVTLKAEPKSGYRFAGWGGDTKSIAPEDLTEAEISYSYSQPSSLRAVFVDETAISADAYVQDGLVALYDGIENVGIGHDASSRVWKDLSGNGHDMSVVTTSGWTAPEWKDGKCVYWASNTMSSAFAYSGTTPFMDSSLRYTIEVIGDYNLKNQKGNWFKVTDGIYFAQSSGLLYYGSGGPGQVNFDFSSAGQTTDERSAAFSFVRDAKDLTFYYQGEQKKRNSVNENTVSFSKISVGSSAAKQSPQGKIYSVRIYNRALSDDEIRRNAAVDQMRFFGTETEGYGEEDGKLTLEMAVRASAGGKVKVAESTDAASSTNVTLKAGTTVVLTAVPDEGATFVGWRGMAGSIVSGSAADATITLRADVAGKIFANFRHEDIMGASDYAQDGLMMHYDAIENDGFYLHSPDTKVWADLSGNGRNAKAGAGNYLPTWGDACFYTTKAAAKRGNFTFPADAELLAFVNDVTNPWTLEVCAKVTSLGAGAEIFYIGGYWGPRWTALNGTSHQDNVYFTIHGKQKGVLASTGPYYGATQHYWFDGERYLAREVNGTEQKVTAEIGTTDTSGNVRIASASYDLNAEFYAVRFYGRRLRTYEKRVNLRLDGVRYLGAEDSVRILGVASGNGNYGTSNPAYGVYERQKGEQVTVAIEGLVQDPLDGVSCAYVDGGLRRAIVDGWSNGPNGAVTKLEGTTSVVLDMKKDVDFHWWWNTQTKLNATAQDGGTVSACGESGTSVVRWLSESEKVTVRATPDARHRFAGWSGTIDGVEDLSAEEIVVSMSVGRDLVAKFVEKEHQPITLKWTADGDGDWDDAGNWDQGVPPQDGDTVVIVPETARTVSISGATANLAKLVVSNATLKTSSWGSVVKAAQVTIGKNATLTCEACSADGLQSNRVHVVCDELTVGKDGKIDVNGKGWPGVCGARGVGPGAGRGNDGGAHGGFGGAGSALYYPWPLPRDDVRHPREPGSSGSSENCASTSGAGGGAILIEAAGRVTVDGKVLANASAVVGSSGNCGGGAGGAVDITCQTIVGAGSVTANGSAGISFGGAGSGGCVAVNYDAAAQAELPRPSIVFELRRGSWYGGIACYRHQYGAEEGSLFLTDGALIVPDPFNITARLHLSEPSLHLPSMNLSGRRVTFPQPGFTLVVDGDVTLRASGNYQSFLGLGGEELLSYEVGADRFITGRRRTGGSAASSYSVGGNLSVGQHCEVELRAARLTAADADPADMRPRGGTLTVGKTFSIANGGRYLPLSHGVTGVSVAVKARKFVLENGAVVSADSLGYFGGLGGSGTPMPGQTKYGFGPGSGLGLEIAEGSVDTPYAYIGPCHGGFGAGIRDPNGIYDDKNMPHMPGSGSSYGSGPGGTGGGVIFIEVSGRATVAGQMSAQGDNLAGTYSSSGAGGSIYLKAGGLSLASTARMVAKGCDGNLSGGGGGGRIAVWRRYDMAGSEVTTEEDFVGTVASVTAGKSGNFKTYFATDGTAVFGKCSHGLLISIR